jgi:hypothetical protein
MPCYAPGATFFSSNLVYVGLISGIPFREGAALFPELLGFTVIVTVIVVLFTLGIEYLPLLYYRAVWRVNPPPGAVRTNENVSDWFGANNQWLVGLSGWSVLLALLSNPYTGLYHISPMWWLLVLLITTSFVLYALCTAYWHPCPCPDVSRTRPFLAAKLRRITFLLEKSVAWMSGVGMYFSLRRSVPMFDRALTDTTQDGA